ncbi:MAG TPA: hypothetical protein VHZ53_06900 [Steroidobacteraceae bacterium]|jgi:hypothetical protein|nr:hypothetical protein [Steroidobacteraceae bacterium]
MVSDEVLMPEFRPTDDAPLRSASHCAGVREAMMLALLLIALTATETRADERFHTIDVSPDGGVDARRAAASPAALRAGSPVIADASDPRIGGRGAMGPGRDPGGLPDAAPLGKSGGAMPTGDIFSVPADGGLPRYSATDFSPRRRNVLDQGTGPDAEADWPLLRGTSMWQRMSDFRSHDRVRVLTLWESSGSAVSLQAGRRGDPSLQWTSTSLNRGGATRGLLDKLFSVSIAGAGRTLRGVTHARGAGPSGAMDALK